MNTLLPKYFNWQPLSIAYIKLKLKGVEWILAGGFALELFYGATYRPHGDIDIIIKRSQQRLLVNHFELGKIYIAYKGKLSPFSLNQLYEKPIQDIWILSYNNQSWCLQIMLVDEVDRQWVYKRNSAIKLPYEEIYFEKEEIKILKPEIQLLYKSKSIRAKDQLDFEMINEKLTIPAKEWLKNSLDKCYVNNHIWLT